MLALIAAMTVAALAPEPTAAERPLGAPSAAIKPFFRSLRADELTARAHCKDAGRYQTGYEPALLFREKDKPNARARRLIDLPNGAFCLVGEAAAPVSDDK
jgi:hypothetical protein